MNSSTARQIRRKIRGRNLRQDLLIAFEIKGTFRCHFRGLIRTLANSSKDASGFFTLTSWRISSFIFRLFKRNICRITLISSKSSFRIVFSNRMRIKSNLYLCSLYDVRRGRNTFANNCKTQRFVQRICISQDIGGIRSMFFIIMDMFRLCNVTLSNSTTFTFRIRIVRRLPFYCFSDVNMFRRSIHRDKLAIICVYCSTRISSVLRYMHGGIVRE